MKSVIYLAILLVMPSYKPDKPNSLPREVKKFAKSCILSYFLIDCGEKNIAFSWNKPSPDMEYGYKIWEFKNLKWHVDTLKLTGADRMNGYQWKGEIVISAKYLRDYFVYGENNLLSYDKQVFNKWMEWDKFPSKPLRIDIQKKKGKWETFGLSSPGWTFTPAGSSPPDCQTIKGLKK